LWREDPWNVTPISETKNRSCQNQFGARQLYKSLFSFFLFFFCFDFRRRPWPIKTCTNLTRLYRPLVLTHTRQHRATGGNATHARSCTWLMTAPLFTYTLVNFSHEPTSFSREFEKKTKNKKYVIYLDLAQI
jgi:hypothetical protein